MKTVRILCLAAASIFVVGASFAQQATTNPSTKQGKVSKSGHLSAKGVKKLDRAQREKVTKDVLSKLNLTPQQKAKFRTHREVMLSKIKDLRQSLKGASREEKREKLSALRKENREFLKSTLTKEQRHQFAKLMHERISAIRTQRMQP